MHLTDLADLYDPTLQLTIRGRAYTVHAPTAGVGLRLQALHAALRRAADTGDALDEHDRQRLMLDGDRVVSLVEDSLGPAHEQMVADGVPWPMRQRAGIAAWLYWTSGERAAARAWAAPAEPDTPGEAPAPTPSTSGAGAPTTPTPGSGSTTTSHPTSTSA